MSTLYIFTGLPYSGKTTLRKELVNRLGLAYVSVDEIMKDRNMWREGHPTQGDWNKAYTEAYKKIKELLKTGRTVIFDNANLPKRERIDAKKIADKLGIESKLIYFNISQDEAYKRRTVNETTKKRSHLSDNWMLKAINHFEEPTSDENPIFYSGTEDLENWIKQNID